MNLDTVTIEDCIEMYERKGRCVVINDGKIVRFCKETENRKVLPPASKQD